jgi:hypothetical protein
MQLQITQTRYPQSVSDGQPDDKAVLRPALASGNADKYCWLVVSLLTHQNWPYLKYFIIVIEIKINGEH